MCTPKSQRNVSRRYCDLREHGRPRQLGVNAVGGGVGRHSGEGHGRGQPVLVAELGGGHAVELLHLVEVPLGGHQHTRHLALHVVLLGRDGEGRGRGRGGGRGRERERQRVSLSLASVLYTYACIMLEFQPCVGLCIYKKQPQKNM